MKIYALSMDRNLVAIGFRRIVASAQAAGFDVHPIYFLDNALEPSFAGSWWKQKTGENFSVNYVDNKEALKKLGEMMADADVLAFSLMSVQRNIAKEIVENAKRANPSVKVIIGGYHPTIFPEDAITFADTICIGEGERVIVNFLTRVKEGASLSGIPNTWVKENGAVIRNGWDGLMTPAEMEHMPFMIHGTENQRIFSYKHGTMHQLNAEMMMLHLGTTFNTIWSVGCPYRCSYCSQDKFLNLDKDYAKYRGPSANYVIDEIKQVVKHLPLDYVIFYDSNFLGRPVEDLKLFAKRFKEEIGLKFILSGTNPISYDEDKIGILVEAGLIRMKMGFESGNDDMLKFFARPTRTRHLERAADVLSKFKGKLVATAYEMIVDNPHESLEQLYDTIDFLDKIPGPYTLSLFSLHYMPGTPLSEKYAPDKIVEQMEKEYMFSYKPSAINLVLSVFAICKPPHFVVKFLKWLIKGRENNTYPRLKEILFKGMLIRRGLNQARYGDFSTFPWWVMRLYHKYRKFLGLTPSPRLSAAPDSN